MRFYDITFFNWREDREDIKVFFEKGLIRITSEDSIYARPCITIHVEDNDTEIIKFKNAVISAFDSYMRRKKRTKELGGDEDDS